MQFAGMGKKNTANAQSEGRDTTEEFLEHPKRVVLV